MRTKPTASSPLYQPVMVSKSALPTNRDSDKLFACCKPRHMNSIQLKLGPQRNKKGGVVLGEPIVEGCFDTPPVTAWNEHPIPVCSVAGVHLKGHWCQVQNVFGSRGIYSRGNHVFLVLQRETSLKLLNANHSVKLLFNHFSSRPA